MYFWFLATPSIQQVWCCLDRSCIYRRNTYTANSQTTEVVALAAEAMEKGVVAMGKARSMEADKVVGLEAARERAEGVVALVAASDPQRDSYTCLSDLQRKGLHLPRCRARPHTCAEVEWCSCTTEGAMGCLCDRHMSESNRPDTRFAAFRVKLSLRFASLRSRPRQSVRGLRCRCRWLCS